MTFDCTNCSTGRTIYTCPFYSPALEKCDFPKKHDVEREMKWRIENE